MVWLSASHLLRGADLSPLRAQLAKAEEADDKAAVIELGRRILATAPKENALWEKVARAQIDTKDFERCAQTLDAWEKAVKPPPAAIEDFRGDLAFTKKEYENAERHWLAFQARKPSNEGAGNVYDKLADLCADQSRWADHEKYRAKGVAAKDSPERRVAHATGLLRLHQWDAAYAEIAKANKMDPTDAQVKEWLPQFERLATFLPRIKPLDAQIDKSPDNVDLLLERARLFTLAERPLLAMDDCERAIKLRPDSMRVRIQTGEAFLDVKRDEDAAKLKISSGIKRESPGHVGEQALRELSEQDARIAQNPKDASALSERAKSLGALQQPVLALEAANSALAADDKSASAHLEAARGYNALDQPAEALSHASKATELDQKNGAAWLLRGRLEEARTNFASAIESLTKSINLEESLEALRLREKCERRLGKIKEADADLARIQALEPPPEGGRK